MKKWNVMWILWVGFSLVFLGFASKPSAKEQEMQKEIAEEILRFHVLANSDSEEDQQEKMQVKYAVVEYLEPILAAAQSKEETITIINQELFNIEEIAQELVAPREVTVSVETDWFPEIEYGDCTFPEGIYDTLRIQIGEAEGHNWWCVLYPGLCFSNAVKPVVTEEGKNLLKNVLDGECFDFLLHPAKTKIRFRLFGLEFFEKNR